MVKVEAPRPELIGTETIVDGWPVQYVELKDQPAVRYQKYTRDYTKRSDRPWKIGAKSYGHLANALRTLGTGEQP